MLCTRCQQREATLRTPSPQASAKFAALGVQWPFPSDICNECAAKLWKDPEFRVRFDAFAKAMRSKALTDFEKALRGGALKLLDFADRLADKF